jgi:hypothetical protein
VGLRDQIAADIDSVFLNLDEFGEEHVIDGRTVVCVIDDDSRGQMGSGDLDGVFVATRRVFVRESDLAREPVVGRRMVMDSKPYLVLSISCEMGMLGVTVTENATV